MKDIIKSLLAGALALAITPLMTSCDNDDDSNPTLHVPESFVLNTPAYAQNNIYDLSTAESVNLTTSQPDYGFPAATTYEVQVSLDQNFTSVTTVDVPENIRYITLASTYTQANMDVDGIELNNAIVSLFQAANGGADPSGVIMPVYVRLVAHLTGTDTGWCASNVITLSKVVVSYIAVLPAEVYVAGSSIRGGTEAKELGSVYGNEGQFYGIVYMTAGSSLKWGDTSTPSNGYSLTTVNDQVGAGLSEAADGGIAFANGGWYALHMKTSIEDNSVKSTLTVYPATAYVTGAVAGDVWDDPNTGWELTPPADASGEWVSPAFAGSGELRAYIKIPGLDWWRTEFTLYNGNLYWRDADIANDWATNVGAAYSVTCGVGQKLYVDFDYDKGEVK